MLVLGQIFLLPNFHLVHLLHLRSTPIKVCYTFSDHLTPSNLQPLSKSCSSPLAKSKTHNSLLLSHPRSYLFIFRDYRLSQRAYERSRVSPYIQKTYLTNSHSFRSLDFMGFLWDFIYWRYKRSCLSKG
ncbi:hypothetical protein BC829DRAFT_84772 [Chytridium lagenaria]|nr:hypothetical protein BC829DRAFT_84772 [Chytridium lagenaria]